LALCTRFTSGVPAARDEHRHSASWCFGAAVGYHLLELLYYGARFTPAVVPAINKAYARLMFGRPQERVARSDQVFNIDCLFKQVLETFAHSAFSQAVHFSVNLYVSMSASGVSRRKSALKQSALCSSLLHRPL